MQRNSLSQVRTESRTAAHRVGNTTVWAEKQACTFSALSKHIFDTSNHKQNMLWAQKYQKSAFTQGLKVKSDVKIPHSRLSSGPVMYGCAAIGSVSPTTRY